MRGFLASSIGVTCAAALALPLTPPAVAAHQAPVTASRPAPSAEVLGGTQSLPLAPVARDRTLAPAGEQGVSRRDVRHFSLVGVVWDDPDTALHGSVQVRTRAAGTDTWSGWQDLETHNDDAADPGTAERTSGQVRGATAPLWVGDSDGVEARVRAETDRTAEDEADGSRTTVAAAPLPTGLRLELVDPGEAAEGEVARSGVDRRGVARRGVARRGGTHRSAPTAEPVAALAALAATDASAANAGLGVLGATELPALDRKQTEQELFALRAGELTEQQRVKPYIGPRPRIVTRRGWGADEKLREKKFVYTKKAKAAFVHHTASGNGYSCAQAPSLIRGIYRYHVKSMGWRDIGYNFLVDKCGNIYEGRAGGVAKPVLGAHTLGFNTNSVGIAVLGSYESTKPSAAAVKAVARLTAWKLGLYGANPSGKTYLKSGGGNLYRKGKNVRLNVISGHRDGFNTECPGRLLYSKLGSTRSTAARYQGR
ncbi:peptidoglycan recognition protein [Streptomyces sp. SID13726]|uniref:peptidoglycan recognition protein family protein n=1 Tax=Streptomyces sp. SID13726 TaxID=2706058 RepID=UPI0013B980A4|nr:peptidoglycan recognition protein [Streptomyces sp. SID13726]NEB03333.1 peptidoglycan recognition protein [Streptomyces sp. SID13726]